MTARARSDRTRSDRPRGRKRGVLLLLVAALVAAGSVAAERLTSSSMLEAPDPQPVAMADAGAAYCPIVGGEGDSAQLEISSASATEDSEVVITRYSSGVAVADEPRVLQPGQSEVLDVTVEQLGTPVVMEWRGGPAVAQYRLAGAAGGEGEVAVAPCETQPSDRWYLAGFDTVRGSTSTLYLFNPFEQDAVVSLQFGTTEGPVDLVIAGDIQVPAGQVVVRDLAELRPETDDLAVSVIAEVGRVVAQGQVVRGPAGEGLEGITGRELLPAVATPSSQLFLPEATVDDETESWVTVYNPSDRQAAVQLQVSTPLGEATALAAELTVPAGGTARVDLAGLSALPRLGVRLESVNGIGLIATRISAVQSEGRAGVSMASAAPAADVSWTVVGARGPEAVLTLFNPGTEIAVASVRVVGDTTSDGWGEVEVPPNAVTSLPLADIDAGGTALVSSDLPIVTGLAHLGAGGATAHWSTTGFATSSLVGGGEALVVERDPGLASAPVVSATATPTPVPEVGDDGGEGALDPTSPPSVLPVPSVIPTPTDDAPPAPDPTSRPTTNATPPPTGATPSPSPTPTPTPTDGDPAPSPQATVTEDSLFG